MTGHTSPNTPTSPGSTSADKQQHPGGKVISTTTPAQPAAKKSTRKSAATANKRPAKKASKSTATAGKSTSGKKAKPAKNGKSKKIKMVRDSYTMPENDYAKLAELKKICLKAGVPVKKSELLRAGLTVLAKLSTPALLKTVEQVEKIKTGRPGKH